jgi:hypothetical protein
MTKRARFDRNFASVMLSIPARRVCLGLVLLAWPACSACKVYDRGLVASVDIPAMTTPMPEASVPVEASPRVDSCVAAAESCNGADDDCDGKSDEAPEAESDCMTRVVHARSICQAGLCVFLRECDPGYFNCDGRPDNGCEASCPCATGCPSVGDDGGSDAGS